MRLSSFNPVRSNVQLAGDGLSPLVESTRPMLQTRPPNAYAMIVRLSPRHFHILLPSVSLNALVVFIDAANIATEEAERRIQPPNELPVQTGLHPVELA